MSKSPEEVSKLYAENEHLIVIILNEICASRWHKLPEDRKHELLQVGSLGLLEGIDRFDPEKGKIGPTVRHRIWRAITESLDNPSERAVSITKHGRSRARKERGEELDSHTSAVLHQHFTSPPEAIDEDFDIASWNPNPEEQIIRREEEEAEEELMDKVNEQMKSLSPLEASVVREMSEGKTSREVGKLLGLTSGQLETIYRKAIHKIRVMNGVE